MLYAFFWVIPRRLNCICRRFGTLCSIFIGGVSSKNNGDETRSRPHHLPIGSGYFRAKTFSRANTPTVSSRLFFPLTPPMKMGQSVPKRRQIQFRRRESPNRKNTASKQLMYGSKRREICASARREGEWVEQNYESTYFLSRYWV